LLQRFARLGQQPRILQRNDRLRGELLQERNLLVGKRPHLLAEDCNYAAKLAFFEHRYIERGSSPTQPWVKGEHWGKRGFRRDVSHMDRSFCQL